MRLCAACAKEARMWGYMHLGPEGNPHLLVLTGQRVRVYRVSAALEQRLFQAEDARQGRAMIDSVVGRGRGAK